MARKPLSDSDFSRLLAHLREETTDVDRKLSRLYFSRGSFSGPQAAQLLRNFKTAPEKIRVLRMIESRLCRMSCSEGKQILDTVQLTQRDKLYSLDYIKRTLCDHQTMEGTEYILKAFNSEDEKLRALDRLTTISSYAKEEIGAGGYFMPGANGSIFSSGVPMSEHAYGPSKQQLFEKYGMACRRNFPETLKQNPKSMYTCHPSYSYGRTNDPSFYRYGGRPPLPPRPIDTAVTGPAKSLHPKYPTRFDATGPSVCWKRGDPCLGAEQSGVTPVGFIDHKEKEYSSCC